MNAIKLLGFLAVSVWIGCGTDDIGPEDQPLDPELGVIADGKSDAFGLTAAQLQAVLDYSNRPIVDEAAFIAELDAELNIRAARNIAAHRVGGDGLVGTADDGVFASVDDLDAVSYVGINAFRGLLELATAAGFGTPGVECLEALGINGGVLLVLDLEDLKSIERSGCTQVNGDVRVDLDRSMVMPSRYWDLSALRQIEVISGGFFIETSNNSLRDLTFPKLRSVLALDVDLYVLPSPSISAPSLTTAQAISLEGVAAADFGGLTSIDDLHLYRHMSDVTGFGGLVDAGTIEVQAWGRGHRVEFPALRHVDSLELTAPRDEVSSLDLGNLRSAGDVTVRGLQSASPVFDALEAIEGNLTVSNSKRPGAWFPVLEGIDGDVEFSDTNSLEDLDMPKLVRIGGDFLFEARAAGPVFNRLESVGGELEARVTSCPSANLEGFARLTDIGSLMAVFGAGCTGRSFEALEALPGGLELFAETQQELGGLPNLVAVLGDVYVGHENAKLASLDYIGGSLHVSGAQAVGGLNHLETVEGDVMFGRSSVRSITGFARVESIGGDITFPAQMSVATQQQFVDQLRSFDGNVGTY